MNDNSINHKQRNKQESNTLNVLLQSLKFQLSELNETNKKIESKSNNRGLVSRKK
ncbi:MAG TPA: hypothetical protein VMZ91_03190 [Candidatus Paceibacterota bacterium]|nr:hypothetical protein [Candidatus Paceibacterota bacterium]